MGKAHSLKEFVHVHTEADVQAGQALQPVPLMSVTSPSQISTLAVNQLSTLPSAYKSPVPIFT